MESKYKYPERLKKFMENNFPFSEFKEIGIFTKEMKNDYEAQAEKVCKYFGFQSVYEYGAMEFNCHISYTDRPIHLNEEGILKQEPFITRITSDYE